VAEYTLRVTEDELARYRRMAAYALAGEREAFLAAGITEGATVADVGCGPAAIAAELGRLVGPTGHVIGIERAPEALAAARQLLADGPDNVELRQGVATDTGVEPGSVDVAMMRHVLAHNGGDEQVIVDHLATLPRSGGTVYLFDVDLSAFRVRGLVDELQDLHDRYVQFHRGRGNDPTVGLRLADLAREAGLTDVEHRGWFNIQTVPSGMRGPAWAARDQMLADGVVTEQEVEAWDAAFQRVDTATKRPTMFAAEFSCVARVR